MTAAGGATCELRCPGCTESGVFPVGAAVTCPACGADFWAVANQDTGQAFGKAPPAPGALASAWGVVAAAGVLAALLALLAAEVAGVIWLGRAVLG